MWGHVETLVTVVFITDDYFSCLTRFISLYINMICHASLILVLKSFFFMLNAFYFSISFEKKIQS